MDRNKKPIALIAGAANEIGAAVTARLTGAGWTMLGIDAIPEEEQNMAQDLAAYYYLDMTERKSFKETVAEMEAVHGPIQALLCVTGLEASRQSGTFLETSIAQWQRTLEGWLKSSVNACAAVAPYMVKRKEGRIMILSPDYSKVQEENILNAAGAGTLHGYAKSFGVEMAKENVLVNCLYPNLPFDHEAIAASVQFLAESGSYVSAQVVSIRGKE